ncbi:hypothetical protein ACP4OV_029976 [Aristida adscensionis]
MSDSDERMFEMDCESPSSPEDISMQHQGTRDVLEGIIRPSTQVEIEIHERAMKHVREIGEERKRSILKRRLMMRLRMDGYDASLCRSSWVATTEHPGGDHEYIDVAVAVEDDGAASSSSSSSRLVVDVDFRSQFEVARPAAWYAQLWSRLPPVFVGPRPRLRRAVSLLCAAAQRSLRESGLQVPPWRRAGYVHAKWLPSGAAAVEGDPAAQPQWSMGKERRRRGPRSSGGGLSAELSVSVSVSGSGAEADVVDLSR